MRPKDRILREKGGGGGVESSDGGSQIGTGFRASQEKRLKSSLSSLSLFAEPKF